MKELFGGACYFACSADYYLNELGYKDSHIYKSFTGCEIQEHLHTNSLDVLSPTGEVVYHQEEDVMNLEDMSQYYTYSDKYFF